MAFACRENAKIIMKENKRLLKELPYFFLNIPIVHGQFNNNLSVPFTPRKYLDHLPSLYDFDLFSLNLSLNRDIDPDQNAMSNHIRCRYFSPNSFYKEKCNLGLDYLSKASFSIFHNNISSLRANIENLQTHILEELDFPFSIIGITESRIRNEDLRAFNYDIPCYSFEYVPTPLAAGGVGMYIRQDYDYRVIEKTSEIAYQALWIEVIFSQKKSILFVVLHIGSIITRNVFQSISMIS